MPGCPATGGGVIFGGGVGVEVGVRVAVGETNWGLGVEVGVAASATRVGVDVGKAVTVAVAPGIGVIVWVGRSLSPTGSGSLAGWGLKLQPVTIIIPKHKVAKAAR